MFAYGQLKITDLVRIDYTITIPKNIIRKKLEFSTYHSPKSFTVQELSA